MAPAGDQEDQERFLEEEKEGEFGNSGQGYQKEDRWETVRGELEGKRRGGEGKKKRERRKRKEVRIKGKMGL